MTPHKDDAIFYGWYIAIFASFANFMATGSSFYIMNAFMEPLCQTRGWTRTDVNVALMLGMTSGFICQLFYGSIVMRVGPRILMVLGAIVGGTACILLGRTHSLWQFNLLYVMLYAGNMGYAGIVANTAVNNWFEKRRGKALGVATSGMSLSGAVLPLVAMIIILQTDIPTAFLWLGAVVLTVAPLAWLIVKDWPEKYGLYPDGLDPFPGYPIGEDDAPSTPSDQALGPTWSLPLLIRTGAFWKIGFAFALLLTGVGGVMAQLKPRFADIGFAPMTAMVLMSSSALCGAVAKYVWGMLCDRIEPRKIVAAIMVMSAGGLILALFKTSIVAVILFVVIFGFAMGGALSVFPIITAEIFGRTSFPAVARFLYLFLILQLTGFIIMGRSYDLLGSYDAAYCLFIVLDLVAALLILSLKQPQAVRGRKGGS